MTTAVRRINLARAWDGTRRQCVTVAVERDGAVTLTAHDMGAGPYAAWNDDDEVSVTVAADEVASLAVALLTEALDGGKDAVVRLSTICELNDIAYRIVRWS